MKNIFNILFIITLNINAQTRDKDLVIMQKSCECISLIDENIIFSKNHFYKEIKKCIDTEIQQYQSIGDKQTEVNFTNNNTGNELENANYIKYYGTIENLLLLNCKDLRIRISATEIGMEKTLPSENPKALEYFYIGVRDMMSENWKKAIKFNKKAIKEDPNFIFAWDNLGLSYRKLNKLDDALMAYEKSLSINPYGSMSLQNIAVVYIHLNKYQKALEAYDKFGMLYPDDVEVIYGKANLYIRHIQNYALGLDLACKAYQMYDVVHSPYRSDALNLIQIARKKMKENKQEDLYISILRNNNFE